MNNVLSIVGPIVYTVNWSDFGPRRDFGPNEKKVILWTHNITMYDSCIVLLLLVYTLIVCAPWPFLPGYL